jgi:hypothetical protein
VRQGCSRIPVRAHEQMCCLLHTAALALRTHTLVPAFRERCMQRSWPARARPAAMSVLNDHAELRSNVHAVASARCSWDVTALSPTTAHRKCPCKTADVLDAQPWPPHERHGHHCSLQGRGSCTAAETACAVHRCARTSTCRSTRTSTLPTTRASARPSPRLSTCLTTGRACCSPATWCARAARHRGACLDSTAPLLQRLRQALLSPVLSRAGTALSGADACPLLDSTAPLLRRRKQALLS